MWLLVLATLLIVGNVRCWQLQGIFQTADSGCSSCLNNNSFTHQCQCPLSSTGALTLRILNDCSQSLHGGDVAVCSAQDYDFHGAYGGVFQLDDAALGTFGCRAPNPATGACNCPFGFAETQLRALVDTYSQGPIIGSTVVFCSNSTAQPSTADTAGYGGVYQVLDKGRSCAAANIFTGSCSCPADFQPSPFRAIYDGPEGSWVYVCVPVVLPPAIAPSAGEPLYLYVSLKGNDANNGTLPSFPVSTISRALAVASTIIASRRAVGRNITIRVFEGVYYQENTIQWSSSACGDRASLQYVSMTSYPPGAKVVLSGGTPVEGFSFLKSTGIADLYSVSINRSSLLTQQFVWQLFQAGGNDSSAYTRIPLHARETAQYTALSSSTPPIKFVLAPEDALPPQTTLDSVFAVMYHSWTSTINSIASYDASTRTMTLSGSAPDNIYNTASGNRYRLINLREDAHVQPGTYLFNGTSFEVILAVEKGGPPPSGVIAPRLATILSIQGPCNQLVVENITFAHTDSFLHEQCLSYGCSGQSGSFLSTAAVEVANAVSHVDFRHVTVAHTGGYALWFHGATNSITVQYGTLRDLGAGGVRIGEPLSGAISSRSLLASNIIVADSVITDAGHIIESGAGVLLQQAASCLIHHNNIFNLFYTGVSTGWTWGYAPTSNNNIIVRENRIYNIGRGLLSDMGCVYNLGTSPGTVVDHNICHDVQSFGYGGWGLYSDEGTSYVKWSNNIVYRTKGAPYHQHYGIHNSVTNNVLAFPQYILGEPYPQANGDFAAVRSSPSPTGYESLTSFTLMTNIVYIRNASSSLFFATTTQAFINVTADYNVYFNAMQPTASLRFPCWNGMSSWSAWQALGEDLHSVLADPQFVSPDSYDFSDLQKTSPAIALGFDPIDTSRVGPRP